MHLQVDSGGAVTDVAVNLDTLVAETDGAPPAGWAEGWHTARFDYPFDLGVHSTAFASADVEAAVTAALAGANHITVYAVGYATDGIHDVHRNAGGHDGAIVVNPTTATAHYVLFRFSDQTF